MVGGAGMLGGAGMAGGASDRVVALDIVRCALPLERPVRIGRTTYRDREYVCLRLRTEGGIEGHAIGYTRGLPLDSMVAQLADGVLGCRLTRRAAVIDGLWASHLNAASSLVRAVSLVDIALWDALARLGGMPLWRLLGGARSRVPVMAVAGYHARERGPAAVEAEVRALSEAGFRHVKLHSADVSLVRRVRAAVPDGTGFAVDVGMAWRDVPEALAAARELDDLGLAFIEDPFPVERWRLIGELAPRLRTPLAAGEDAAGLARLIDLASVVGVLRVDGTASGGFGAVLDAAVVASARGVAVMTHAFPDLHAHLAGASAVGVVEMIPDATGANPVGRLLARRQPVEDGEIVLSEDPGHGAPLDWEAVVGHARASVTLTASDGEEDAGCS
jgi:L-alanine-DL-glutamate epimerase-like enolase superfamily enzyme